MFHRKVHPENSTVPQQKSSKHQKAENRKKIIYKGDHNHGDQDQVPPDEEIMSYPKRSLSKESIRRYKNQSTPLQFTLSSSDSNGNREHWIKTDADCKYRSILHKFVVIIKRRTSYVFTETSLRNWAELLISQFQDANLPHRPNVVFHPCYTLQTIQQKKWELTLFS